MVHVLTTEKSQAIIAYSKNMDELEQYVKILFANKYKHFTFSITSYKNNVYNKLISYMPERELVSKGENEKRVVFTLAEMDMYLEFIHHFHFAVANILREKIIDHYNRIDYEPEDEIELEEQLHCLIGNDYWALSDSRGYIDEFGADTLKVLNDTAFISRCLSEINAEIIDDLEYSGYPRIVKIKNEGGNDEYCYITRTKNYYKPNILENGRPIKWKIKKGNFKCDRNEKYAKCLNSIYR